MAASSAQPVLILKNIMQPRLIPLLILTFCSLLSHAQDISGTWIGNYKKTSLTYNPEKLIVEIFVHSDSIVTGASHLFYKNFKYEHFKTNDCITI